MITEMVGSPATAELVAALDRAEAEASAALGALPSEDEAPSFAEQRSRWNARQRARQLVTNLRRASRSLAKADAALAESRAELELWKQVKAQLTRQRDEAVAAGSERLAGELDAALDALAKGWPSVAGLGPVIPGRLWEMAKVAHLDLDRLRPPLAVEAEVAERSAVLDGALARARAALAEAVEAGAAAA